MKLAKKELGKVCITPKGEWSNQNSYEVLDLVYDVFTNKSYIAKQNVPIGIDISNITYWQKINSAGYKDNNIIIISDTDEYGNLLVYNLESAISSISVEDRHPGLILGFYGQDYRVNEETYTWFMYQFKSNTINDWDNINCWKSIYDNIDKFKGYYETEELLYYQYKFPNIGDFAFVGIDLEHAVVYTCVENNQWKNTNKPALEYANKFDAIYSKDAGEFEVIENETYADRAYKDAKGNNIETTYATKAELNVLIEEINKLKTP